MIGKISGRIEYRAVDHVLIDVRGVGYLVYCSERTLAGLPGVGEVVALYTDLVVREDLMQLFGFPTLVEKEWHRLLTSVQGVGAKASLAILGTLGADGVSRAIALGDWNAVKAAKGVGPKIAQRVVLDLKDKAPAVMAMGGPVAAVSDGGAGAGGIETPAPAAPAAQVPASSQADALSALGNLGYSPGDAAGAVAQAASEAPEAETPVLIRAALKLLAPKG
ncbi:Holliday junction ATP-dependent DNA helicase RuvA [Roseobacter cerasinus]|uniref:Holliday junction branch migration complex subunit RuvA n=1 Tax=Roseobacter cerasinus TaxID=2602289 RepID=A0A640VV57_9RHOB|nr:Holliday junction branch migration protein RuvA [Roseobacter cerasinus]GFE51484.1 Holliday junction ATP-dependent DNA helicase RuvA [Roseobacter cerasinus]